MSWDEKTRKRQAKLLDQRLVDIVASALKPPPRLTVSQWADEYRYLSSESSAEAGKWSTGRAEYQRGMMDAVSDPSVETVVLMTAAQVGKTELINNVVGFHIAQNPCPMLVVQPTLEMAQTWAKDRLSPSIRDTPALRSRIADPKSRDSGNTTLHKTFKGGHVTACGANSPSSLASRPCRLILCDEVDRYPVSAGSEGDPVALAKRRSATFWNRKIILVSTPTTQGASRIEAAYEESDQRRYFVKCPDCHEYQHLKWSQVQWQKDLPGTACYMCEHCGTLWNDAARFRAVRYGEWRSTAPGDGKTAGFHLNALYSPWATLEDGVRDFLASKGDPMRLRAWVNTFLGETFSDISSQAEVDEHELMGRAIDWGDELPEDVVAITIGIDVQDSYLAIETVGWAQGEKSYSLAYDTIVGDPSTASLWQDLAEFLRRTYDHPLLGEMSHRSACIDTGGHYTQQTYEFVKSQTGKRVFAIKGVGGDGRPIISRPSRNNIGRLNLFSVGVNTVKEMIYARLKIQQDGPGYCHFPISRDAEYYRMLTAERRVTKYYKGRPKLEWVKVRARNEALDCRVYAIAALAIANVNLDLLYKKAINDVKVQSATRGRRGRLSSPRNFVTGYA
jgi:phage terminase large subunit GpA-like protein